MSDGRLLSINNYHYRRGGADIVYLEHAAMFEQLGWASAHFAMRHPRNLPSPWSEHFVDEIELGGQYTFAEKVSKSLKVIYSLEARRKLDRVIQDFRPTIAHLHNIYHHLSPSILHTLRDRGVPVVLTAHDLKIACPNYRMLSGGEICERCKGGRYHNVVLRRCVHGSLPASILVSMEATLHSMLETYRRHVDRIVVPSRFFLDKFVEWGWSPGKFTYIPNFVDSQALEPDFEAGGYILYFGRLSKEKGLDTLVHAAAAAAVPLKIAGTGPDEEQVRSTAAALGADVDFLGFRSGKDLHDLIRQSRAVVLPSEWYENAPLSVLESFALGKPVMGARIGGIPELIEPGSTGWLFDSGNREMLAELLREVCAIAPGDIARMGRAARASAEQRFSRSAYLRSTLDLYEEVADGHPSRRTA